jgi:hypothetical protein
MSFERQTRGGDRYGLVRARLECGKCGRMFDRLAADPEDPNWGALPRLWRPANPSRRRWQVKRSYRPAVAPVHPGEYSHRYVCVPECGEDFQSGSYRLGRVIVAKAAGRTGTVRLRTGIDV